LRALQHDFQEKCRREVLPLLPADERSAIDAFFKRFADRAKHFRFQPALVHSDLGMDHVLVDGMTGLVTGIIDFGDAEIGDPAGDFAGMRKDLRRAALETYNLDPGDAFEARVEYGWKIGPFHDVIFGIGDGGPEHVQAGLDGIRKRVLGRTGAVR
jgi:aminoglycoside 2''-phosphotransferase